jgi:hypothetical protein
LRGRRLFIAGGALAFVLAVSAASFGDVGRTIVVVALFATPLTMSVLALLDAASRPEWVWALAQRRRVVWMGGIMAAALLLPIGLAVSAWYLGRVRAELRATERGTIRDR